jgi:hypothetical protein
MEAKPVIDAPEHEYRGASHTATTNACKLCTPWGHPGLSGVEGGHPFLHGSQGCATYMRRYVISHFREPMDIASSSLGEKNAIYGGGPNLKKGLLNAMRKYGAGVVGGHHLPHRDHRRRRAAPHRRVPGRVRRPAPGRHRARVHAQLLRHARGRLPRRRAGAGRAAVRGADAAQRPHEPHARVRVPGGHAPPEGARPRLRPRFRHAAGLLRDLGRPGLAGLREHPLRGRARGPHPRHGRRPGLGGAWPGH